MNYTVNPQQAYAGKENTMLSKQTKNDVSGDFCKVDVQALIYVSKIAVRELTEVVSRHLSVIRETAFHPIDSKLSLNGEWLMNAAQSLNIACDTLSTLLYAQKENETRDIEIVNR